MSASQWRSYFTKVKKFRSSKTSMQHKFTVMQLQSKVITAVPSIAVTAIATLLNEPFLTWRSTAQRTFGRHILSIHWSHLSKEEKGKTIFNLQNRPRFLRLSVITAIYQSPYILYMRVVICWQQSIFTLINIFISI